MDKKVSKLLEVIGLSVYLYNNQKKTLLNNISFSINRSETLCLVGESGSGKTMTALSILNLLPQDTFTTHGKIQFEGINILQNESSMSKTIRGSGITIIFQNALSALNPVFKCGIQILDVVKTHLGLNNINAKERVLNLFLQVNLREAERVYHSYPHQLSGGMAQRVMIAMALSCNPRLIIADEPTSSLDVSTQNIILTLLKKLQHDKKFSLLLITHDIRIALLMASKIGVMLDGNIVEQNYAKTLLKNPSHIYTRKLLEAYHLNADSPMITEEMADEMQIMHQ
jgi:ABC-type dipeptide/oligopeptide/nickel transport system ATPase component